MHHPDLTLPDEDEYGEMDKDDKAVCGPCLYLLCMPCTHNSAVCLSSLHGSLSPSLDALYSAYLSTDESQGVPLVAQSCRRC